MLKEVATNRRFDLTLAVYLLSSFILLFFAYGVDIGVFYAITTLLDQILEPFHYISNDTGILVALARADYPRLVRLHNCGGWLGWGYHWWIQYVFGIITLTP